MLNIHYRTHENIWFNQNIALSHAVDEKVKAVNPAVVEAGTS